MPELHVDPKNGDQPLKADPGQPGRRNQSVQQAVLSALGRPPSLYSVSVRPLWADHFRVNVLIGSDPTSLRIAHSFFVQIGESGDVLASTPLIVRAYP